MKTLLLLMPFIYFSCTEHSEQRKKMGKNGNIPILSNTDTFEIVCDKPEIETLIDHSDTTYELPNYTGHTIKSFDKKKRLVQVFKSNLFESNSKYIYSTTTIYDTAGHIIYEDQTKEFIRWHCYRYQFDLNGHLISKQGYSSGEIGVKSTFMYDGDKLIKEITERGGQRFEKVY